MGMLLHHHNEKKAEKKITPPVEEKKVEPKETLEKEFAVKRRTKKEA